MTLSYIAKEYLLEKNLNISKWLKLDQNNSKKFATYSLIQECCVALVTVVKYFFYSVKKFQGSALDFYLRAVGSE